jgi:hypothetical protein
LLFGRRRSSGGGDLVAQIDEPFDVLADAQIALEERDRRGRLRS